MHQDTGTFQIYRGDQQLAPEHTGYCDTFQDGSSSEDTTAHNGILYNGEGEECLEHKWAGTGASLWRAIPISPMRRSTYPTYTDPRDPQVR